MYIRQKKGAITMGAVTLAVLVGAVTWNPLASTKEADAGETLRLEPADPQPAGVTAREQGLLDENQELKRRLAEAESQATRTRMEAEDVVTPIAADGLPGFGSMRSAWQGISMSGKAWTRTPVQKSP